MSLSPKIDEVREVIRCDNYEFVSLVETWLQNHIHDNVINIQGYNLIRRDIPVTGLSSWMLCKVYHCIMLYYVVSDKLINKINKTESKAPTVVFVFILKIL